MQRYRILHRTFYNFSAPVRLEPHTLRLRPREGHALHIEASTLVITPTASLRWLRDPQDNCLALAEFAEETTQLRIESDLVVQQYNDNPFDFLVADHALIHPFSYTTDEAAILAPYMSPFESDWNHTLDQWIEDLRGGSATQESLALLQRMNAKINSTCVYQQRAAPGMQAVVETLANRTGSCRDFAQLFIEAARRMGFAARFVSGYLHAPPSSMDFGATHAWAEVYLPGAGWKGFDPTLDQIAGAGHFAVAVARDPESVPPVAGSFVGVADASLDVGVWVTELPEPGA